MKKFSLALVMIFMALGVAYAQKPVKGSYTKAQSYLKKGEIAEAKKYIDAAVATEKLAKKSMTWFVKGQVYQAIALSDDDAIKSLAPNAFQEALDAYSKLKEIDGEEGSTYKQLIKNDVDFTTNTMKPSILEEFYNAYFEMGRTQYADEKYEEGMKSFEKCYAIMPEDTLSGIYALTCAQIANSNEGVIRNVKVLQAMDYHKPTLYIEWARYEYRKASKEEDEAKEKAAWEKVIEIAQKGIDKNPNNVDLVKFMTDAYIRLERKEDAVAALQKSVDADPNDKMAYFSLGTLQDELGDTKAAEAAFEKAVEIDPEFFNAYFNYFVMYNNRLRDKSKELNELAIDARGQYKDKAAAEAIENEMTELRKKALVILEKAQKIQPDNETVNENIEFIKKQLNK